MMKRLTLLPSSDTSRTCCHLSTVAYTRNRGATVDTEISAEAQIALLQFSVSTRNYYKLQLQYMPVVFNVGYATPSYTNPNETQEPPEP
jgi:hypothetical protein